MTDDRQWVEIKVWHRVKGTRTLMKFRGELRELKLDRDVMEVPSERGHYREYVPIDEYGSLRWLRRDWKMDHGSPQGFFPPREDLDARGDPK